MPILPMTIIRALLFLLLVGNSQVTVSIDELQDGRLERSYIAEWQETILTVVQIEEGRETRYFEADWDVDDFGFAVRRFDESGRRVVEEDDVDLGDELQQFAEVYIGDGFPIEVESVEGDRWELQVGLAAAYMTSQMLSRQFAIALPAVHRE